MHRFNFRLVAVYWLLFMVVCFAFARSALASVPRQDSYPPPTPETINPLRGEIVPTAEAPLPYPPAGVEFDIVTPAPIGGQNGVEIPQGTFNADTGASQQSATQPDSRGLLFLWLAFGATLLIFLTSVIGSIVLFTRRNEP